MRTLNERVAVVTGAGSGIGRATAMELARKGCAIAVVDVNELAATETARMVQGLGARAALYLADVRNVERMEGLAAEVVADLGGCNILMNNAGVTSAGAFEEEQLADLRWIVDINVWGVVNGCRAFLPALRAADEAHIVNMSSMVGLLGLPHNAAYSLTKGAVRAFSEALRAELVTTNIGVTTVFPGAIHTNITNAARGAEGERLAKLGNSRLAPIAMKSPDSVAARIVDAVERDRARVVIGPDAHVVSLISRLLPGRSGLVGRLTNRLTH